MLRVLLFLLSLLGTLPLTSSSAAQTPAPTSAAKLRRLLPLPEGTLRPKIELNIGLAYVPGGTSALVRQSSDYAAQIVAVRRTLTGDVADAPRYIHLGYLYRQAGLNDKSHAAFQQSELLCQNALRRNPRDGFAMAEYGRTLAASGQTVKAETYLRNAIRSVPRSADIWWAFGSILGTRVSPRTETTAHYARATAAAYGRAIFLAPRNPALWKARGDFRTFVLPQLQGTWFSRDGQSDYERVARLDPNNPYAQAQVPTVDYGWVEVHYNVPTSPEAAGRETPDADHRAKLVLKRITAIAEATQGRQSAEAYAARAWVQFQFCYDPHGAQRSLRLALKENPDEQDAIDYQLHVAAVTGDYSLLAAACRRELKRRPAVYLRLLLAGTDYDLAQQKPEYWREGLTQMELAHAAQPNDYACALGLAVFLLEAGQTARADLLLAEIAPQAQKHPKEQQTEYDITRGIGGALRGNEKEAQAFLTAALRNEPNNRAAKSAMNLIGPL